jgi:hypothetical protein
MVSLLWISNSGGGIFSYEKKKKKNLKRQKAKKQTEKRYQPGTKKIE